MKCSQGTKDIFSQIQILLNQLDQDAYTHPVLLFKGATLGQHFRHILDFYNCLVEGALLGNLDYSKRARNPLMETQIEIAKDAFNMLCTKIENLNDDQAVEVLTDFSTSDDDDRVSVNSSIGRELMYAYDHAVHHLAIIRMGIQTVFPDVRIDDRVGVAPSTVKYKMKK